MKILVTGFAPFGGEKINPAMEAVEGLSAKVAGATVIKSVLPTVFGKGAEALYALTDTHRPDIVLCTGKAGGRSALSIERVAINLRAATIADNEGNLPVDEAIMAGGRAAYFSNVSTRGLTQYLQDQGIPAVLSYSAGAFVCNEVYYRLLHWIDTEFLAMQAVFLHVPYAPAQVAKMSAPMPSMSVSVVCKGLELAVAFLAGNSEEL